MSPLAMHGGRTSQDVCAIIVTRGDVDVTEIVQSYVGAVGELIVWDNSSNEDLAVYGRYAAIETTTAPIILVQDDDVLLSSKALGGLLVSHEPGVLVANMPQEYRARYHDTALVGFGAIFDRDLPEQAFRRFVYSDVNRATVKGLSDRGHAWPRWVVDEVGLGPVFRRTCDLVFATLTPHKLVDLPFDYLPWTRAENRMYRQPGNTEERTRMLKLCRKVRDGVAA